jgi:hypothetical protein
MIVDRAAESPCVSIVLRPSPRPLPRTLGVAIRRRINVHKDDNSIGVRVRVVFHMSDTFIGLDCVD